MTTQAEAMKLALEVLVLNNKNWKYLADSGDAGFWSAEEQDHYKQTEYAIKALEEALAKQEGQSNFCPQCEALARELKAAKQEQGEPVGVAHLMQEGFTHCIWSEACVPVGTKFYTTPQQRTWVGLTDEQIKHIYISTTGLKAKLNDSRSIKIRNDWRVFKPCFTQKFINQQAFPIFSIPLCAHVLRLFCNVTNDCVIFLVLFIASACVFDF